MKKDWNLKSCDVANHSNNYPAQFDGIIIGAGPAGMTAAIYGARRKMKLLLICGKVGGQMNYCSDIENWTGVAQSTGPALRDQFFAHVKQVDKDNHHFDLWVREQEMVESIAKENGLFIIKTNTGQTFKTRSVICTSGKKPRTLGVPGEEIAMQGNGLSFAATSDAPLYQDKKMVIIGGGNSAMDVALQMDRYSDDVTIMTNLDHLIGETYLMEKIHKSKHISVKYKVNTKAILLDKNNKVRGVTISENGSTDHDFSCEGIFEEIGQIPATGFCRKIVNHNDQGEIITNRLLHTSCPGFFAAGDCNDGYHKQVIVAAGEGAIAALQAHEYCLKT